MASITSLLGRIGSDFTRRQMNSVLQRGQLNLFGLGKRSGVRAAIDRLRRPPSFNFPSPQAAPQSAAPPGGRRNIHIPPRPPGGAMSRPAGQVTPQAPRDPQRPPASPPPVPPQQPPPPPRPPREPPQEPPGGGGRYVDPRNFDRPRGAVQMIRVSGSSNVYAFGYDEDTNQLFVQFLGGGKASRGGPGPVYVYKGVGPTLYGGNTIVDAITSPSAGGWVWDHMRVRGTVERHQHPYELVKLARGGYVPRQATAAGYRPRVVRGRKGTVYHSSLPGTGMFEGRVSGEVQRGEPNRAKPKRGMYY